MKLSDKILDFMKVQNLFYMKDETNTIFDLPYEFEENYKVKIHMTLDEENNRVRVGFIAPLRNESEEVKENILTLSPRLIKGSMGISVSTPNCLEYALSFEIKENEYMTEELYRETIGYCLSLYKNLVHRKILKYVGINEK